MNFKMDNMDDPETNPKISDSAYSNSCSNSQSRRSRSSKSTHSGSNSSGSSGYGGKASTSGSSNILGQPPKKDKEGKSKKKKLSQIEVKAADAVPADEPARPPEPAPILAAPKEESDTVVEMALVIAFPEEAPEAMDTSKPEPTVVKEETSQALQPVSNDENYVTTCPSSSNNSNGFSCVISMHNGVVMHTSDSLTATLGFPKDVWVGRSFIDFVHPKDHKTFASLITNGLALPISENDKDKGPAHISGSTMVCRMRNYRSLVTGFGIKDFVVTFMPFLLKFFFKDYRDDDTKVIYLVIQATSYHCAFKSPKELVLKPIPFVMRHDAEGILVYIDPASVPYLGFLPQDIVDKNALHLYHPDDLPYLRFVYESIVKEGSVSSSRPYRLMTQNGDFIRVETEWSSVTNPWSMKLEFVIAKHHVVEGPTNPDVFRSPDNENSFSISETDKYRMHAIRDSILRIMKKARTKPEEAAKQEMGKRCQNLATFMESLIEDTPKPVEDLRLDIYETQDRDLSYYERDSVMLGGISPHHDSDSKSSIETPLSYNQLNYNENLQRYFDSQALNENSNPFEISNEPGQEKLKPSSSKSFVPMSLNSRESNEQRSSSSEVAISVNSPGPVPVGCYAKLTETIIHKHNVEMEKDMVKKHRESRSSKGDREKASTESRKKKKEHLARCNAIFRPTSAGDTSTVREHRIEMRGVKRPLKPQYNEEHALKHHCPSPPEVYRHPFQTAPSPLLKPPVPLTPVGDAVTQWQTPQNNTHSMTSLPSTSAMPLPGPSNMPLPGPSNMPLPGPSNMPLLGHSNMSLLGASNMPLLGASNMSLLGASNMSLLGASNMPLSGCSYVPVTATSTMTLPIPLNVALPGTSGPSSMEPMPVTPVMTTKPGVYGMPGLSAPSRMPAMPNMPGMAGLYPAYYAPSASNYKLESFPSTSGYQQLQATLPYVVQHPISMIYRQPFVYSAVNPPVCPMGQSLMSHQTMYSTSVNLNTSNYEQTYSDKMASSSTSNCEKSKNTRTSDENAEKTDGESSYSSFYSSFFKTDSGSADDSGDQKNKPKDNNKFYTKNAQGDDSMSQQSSTEAIAFPWFRKPARRRPAPWNKHVNMTTELIYKYQIATKPMNETLEADKQKIAAMEQPALVNEQLSQLYLDLQLQGVAARLTLEEGITSSSSSGEETTPKSETVKRKRDFSKLAIIYEENAPLPSPESGLLVPESTSDNNEDHI